VERLTAKDGLDVGGKVWSVCGPFGLFLLQQRVDNFHNLRLAVVVSLHRGHQFAVLVLGDDSVSGELRLLDLLFALALANFDGGDRNVLPVLLILVIHDDRNLVAEHSSIEIVVGEGSLVFIGEDRGREAEGRQKNQQEEFKRSHWGHRSRLTEPD